MLKLTSFLIKVLSFTISVEPRFWKVKSLSKAAKHTEKDLILRQTSKQFAEVVLQAAGVEVVVEGLENLPEKGCPVVFTPNHSSYFDIPIMLYAVSDIVGFVSKPENARIPFIGKWIKESYSVYIDRSSPALALEGLQAGVEILKQGHRQVIFPEGTRSRSGKVQPFKAGSYKLAKLSDSQVVPVAIVGAANIVQRNGKINAQKVRVKFFETLDKSLNTVEMAKQSQQLIEGYINKFI